MKHNNLIRRGGVFMVLTAAILVGGFFIANFGRAAGLSPVNLLSISTNDFVILSETGITNTGAHGTHITGNIGNSAGTAAQMNGVWCSEITGTIYGVDETYVGSGAGGQTCFVGTAPDKTLVDNAVGDMLTAYNYAAGVPDPTATELGAGDSDKDIGGLTLAPGLYKWSNSVLINTNVTLTGGVNDVWIFQIAGNLSIASTKSVKLTGGAKASNVFWQVGGPTGATLGTYSTFNGNILSAKQIIIQTGATLNGRALAQTQVTLDANTISIPTPATTGPVFIDTNTNNTLDEGELFFNTIQDAVDAASSGDTIVATAETYAENVSISGKSNLTIQGVGVSTVIEPASGIGFEVRTSNNITIKNLKVHTTGAGAHGILVDGTGTGGFGAPGGGVSNNLHIENTTIDAGGTGIWGDSSADGVHSDWFIDHNTITGQEGGIGFQDVTNTTVSYNTITNPAVGTNILLTSERYNLSTLLIDHNTVSGSSGSEVAVITDYNERAGGIMRETPDLIPSTIAGVTFSNNTFDNWGADTDSGRAIRVGQGDGSATTGTVTGININTNTFNMTVDRPEVIGGTDAPSATGSGNIFNVSGTAKIQKAINNAFAGDTINVAAGNYNEHDITINKSLTLTGDVGDAQAGPGANAPIIDGQNLWSDGFLLSNGVSDVTIQGFEIRNYVGTDTGAGNAIQAWVASTNHITVNDNYMHNLSWNGVLVGNDSAIGDHSYWTIARNRLTDFGPGFFDTSGYGLEFTNTSHGVIEDNIIDSGTGNFPGTGILIYNRRSTNQDILIQRNSIRGQYDFAGINVQSSTEEVPASNLDNVRILNNDVDISGPASPTVPSFPDTALRIRNKGTGTVTGVAISDNKLVRTGGYSITNNTTAPLDATNNWWGSAVLADVTAKISGNVNYSPFCTDSTCSVFATADDFYPGAITVENVGSALANGPETINTGATQSAVTNGVITVSGAIRAQNSNSDSSTEGPAIAQYLLIPANSVSVEEFKVVNGTPNSLGIALLNTDPTNPDRGWFDLTKGVFRMGVYLYSGNALRTGDISLKFVFKDANGTVLKDVNYTLRFETTVADVTPPVITRLGDATVTIEVGSTYTDAGATASDNYDGNLTNSINTINSVNSGVVGDYTVTYDVTDTHGNSSNQVVRTVHVVDTTKPIVSALSLSPSSGYAKIGDTVTLHITADAAGYTAGAITVNGVVVSNFADIGNGNYTATYTVMPNNTDRTSGTTPVSVVLTDASNNSNVAYEIVTTNTLEIDAHVPTLVSAKTKSTTTIDLTFSEDLNGTTISNADFSVAGYTLTTPDANDTGTPGIVHLTVSTPFNTGTTPAVSYIGSVKDSAGNVAPIAGPITPTDKVAPIITLNGTTPDIAYGGIYSELGATADDGSTIVITGSVITSAIGSYTITYNATDSAGNVATPITRTVNVIKATQVTLTTTTQTVIYPATFATLASTGGSGTGAVTYAVTTPGTAGCSIVAGALVYTTAGICEVTATQVTDTNYLETSSATQTFTVDKATPTATLAVNNSPVTYNGSGQSAMVVISASSVPGAVANILTGGSAIKTNAEIYAVTADFVPTDTANYNTLTGLSAGNFEINKATPTITWANPADITYGAALSGTQLNASTPVSGSFVYSPVSGTVLNAGAQTLSVVFTPTDITNYNGATQTTTINISKANANTSSITPYSVTYDATPHTATGSALGVKGETLSGLDLSSGTTHTNAGNYASDAWIFTDVTGNYNNANGTIHDAIAQKALTVTAVANTKVYNDNTSAVGTPTITSGVLQGSDSVTWTQTYDTKNVGTGKVLTPNGTVSDNNAGNNYAVTFINNVAGVILAQVPNGLSAGSATANNLLLSWTNPNVSSSDHYVLKYSANEITSGNFDAATATSLGGTPIPANGSQGYIAQNLTADTTYFFALKLVNSLGNTAGIATTSSKTLAPAAAPTDTTAPSAIIDLALQAGSPATSQIKLTWTATGDDGSDGIASKYIIKRSTSAITDNASFNAATTIFNTLSPKSTGSAETLTVTGLSAGTPYYFAIKVQDEVPNNSAISNVANLATLANSPTASAITPTEGENGGAIVIAVTGTNFVDGANTLRFSNSSNTFEIAATYVDSASLTASAPIGAPIGVYSLKVVNSNGTSLALNSAYTVKAAPIPLPTVSDLIPANIGSNDSDVSITIYGANFTGATVAIDTAPETALTITSVSSDKIIATIPGMVVAGTYNIKVTTAGGTNTISSVKLNVKDPVVIDSSTLEQTTTDPIDLSGTSTIPVQITLQSDETIVNTDTVATIEVVIPPATEVTGDDGLAYTGNINPPQIVKTTDEMKEEAGEDAIVITMGNPDEKITFSNDFVVTVTLDSTNTSAPLIWYYNPSAGLEIAGKDGVKDGITYIKGGTVLNTVNNGGVYTYTIGLLLDHMSSYVAGVDPSIDLLSSSSATTGTAITITGTNFSPSATVKFGTTSATVSSLTTTSISVAVPSISAGSYNITVTNTDGLVSNVKTFSVTETPPPSSGGGGGGGTNAYADWQAKQAKLVTPTPITLATPATPAVPGKPAPKVLGEKAYANGTLVRGNDKKIFVIIDGQKKYIASLKELAKYAGQRIYDVKNTVLIQYPEVLGTKVLANGSLMRGADGKIYAIKNGKKQHVRSLEELRKGYFGKKIYDVNNEMLAKY